MLYSALLLLGACASGFAGTLPESTLGQPDDILSAKALTEGSFIIQLKSNAKLGKRLTGQNVHAQFHKRASLAGLDYTVRTEFKNEALFYGLSINLDRNKTLEEVNDIVKDMPEVEGIWPNLLVPKPGPAPGIGNLTDTENEASKKAKVRIGPVDDDSKLPQIKGANVKATHKMTGIDKVHEKGIKGKGVKIGIIDTGIDYRHPALGGGFGPGFKVAGGYSFMDDEWDRYADRDPIEGSDPITTCNDNAHGTHVAGIIGMKDAAGQGFGLIGAAPEATIYMYKVFGCAESRGTTVELIMRAMVKAVEDGVDVISMSLGGNSYFEADSPYASLTEAIRDMGIGLVISNGNDGALGLYAQSTPADGKGVIAVGSITNDYFPVTYRAKDSNGKCFQYGSVWPLVAPELEIYYHGTECSYNSWLATAEAVNKIGADKVIVIAEIHDPKCPLGAQMSGASAFGIPNLLAFTSESLDPSPYARDIETQVPFPSVATVLVPPGTGRKLVENFKKDSSYKLKFPNTTTASGLKLETGGLMSNFSSFGPSWDTVAVKPTLSAPGGKILSTWVLGPSAGYAIISGTSMAAPLVAGCWALLKSQNPGLSASEISKILQSTSTPLPYFPEQTLLSSVAHQGSGMINVYQAIMSETLVSPSELSLGDTDDYEGDIQTIRITNRGSAFKTYTISHKGAGYAEAFPYPDLLEPNYWRGFGQPQYGIYGSSTFDQQTVVVPAGKTVEVQARISPPELTSGQINKTPLMSGFLQLTSSSETYTIPYLGVPYSRQNESALDTTEYQYADGDKTYSPEQPFVFCGSCGTGGRAPNTGFDEYNGTDWNFPSAYFNIITGIQHFQVNVVPANVKFTPTHHGGNPPKDSGYEYMKPDITPRDKWMGLPSYGWIADSSQNNNYAPREVTANYPPYQADALFRWGAVYYHDPQPGEDTFTYLPNGDYRFLLSLLKPGSDYDDLSQWETYLGPVMRLVGDNY